MKITLTKARLKHIFILLGVYLLAACGEFPLGNGGVQAETKQTSTMNPVYHFETPVTDLSRAIRFYEVVLETNLKRQTIDGYAMAFFPRADGQPGASGALVKGDVYVPSKNGAIIYFDVPDIDAVLDRAKENGGEVLYPKKHIGDAGYVTEIEDSEGNRIALTAASG